VGQAHPAAGPRGRVARPLLLTHGVVEARSLVRFAIAGTVLVAVGTLVGLLVVGDTPPGLDRAANDLARSWQTPTVVALARAVSWSGDLPVVSAIALAVVVVAYRRSGRLDLGWLTFATIGGALAVTASVKGLTDRARPDGGLTDTFSSAFPSGHSVRAAAVYSLVAWLVLRWSSRDRRVLRPLAVAAAIAMMLAVGISRLLLGDHWLSDVVAGWIVGVGWLAVVVAVTRPHRVPSSAVAGGPRSPARSGRGVDDERQDLAGPVAPPQQPGRDGEGPA
jgi:membrane-associated phospholipid phosphatase